MMADAMRESTGSDRSSEEREQEGPQQEGTVREIFFFPDEVSTQPLEVAPPADAGVLLY